LFISSQVASSGRLTWWMGGKMRLPVEEMSPLFWRLAIPAMKTTVR
jgi:hypothetical protein